MTKDEIVTTEAEIHQAVTTISNAWYALGMVVGHEAVSKQLRTISGELFAEGKDDMAKLYRSVANQIDADAKTMRKDYEREAGAMQAKETAYGDLQRMVNIFATSIPYDDNNGRDSSHVG